MGQLTSEVDFQVLHQPVFQIVGADVIHIIEKMKLDISPEEAEEIVAYVKNNIKPYVTV